MDDPSELAKSASMLRSEICPRCRAVASAELEEGPPGPQPCEPGCPLFEQLPRLARLVAQAESEPPCGYSMLVGVLLKVKGDAPELGLVLEALALLERAIGRSQRNHL